ncbi:MAG: glycosyltransferase [Candidatus Daviesbacteria bacterium]|nr:glycosyltransferase [Candidatus Daviesbacteria bacterium]
MKIWANCIVHNEENFIWFAIMSVVDFVDKILVWDTGSTDKTVEIIKEIIKIKGDKIEFSEVGLTDKYEFTKMRRSMLDNSECDWILILDGDEIWWESSIKQIIKEINAKGDKIEGIVVPMIVPVGDIFHLQEERAGKYKIHGKKGHISLKAINRRIPGLHVDWPYGKEGYFDKNNKLIQEREEIIFIDAPFLHVTHLKRSGLKKKLEKFKYELGDPVNEDFKFPEVFYQGYPTIIRCPWSKLSGIKLIKARLLTPLRKFKRRLV